MRLVDDQDRVGPVAVVAPRLEPDVRLEDVVVVADDHVGLLEELEGDLEGADLLVPRHLEDDLGIEVGEVARDPVDQAVALHLLLVLRRERAEVLVADHLRVRAHLLLRADAERAERAVVEHLERGDGDLLLERLRGEVEELLAAGERLAERGIDRGDRLADPGRRGDEQRFLLPDGPLDGFDHVALERAHAVVGKLERLREGALRHPERALGLDLLDDPVDRPEQSLLDVLGDEGSVDELHLARDQVDQRELRGEREARVLLA